MEIEGISSIPGPSVIAASCLLDERCNVNRFQTVAKLAVFCGVVPVADESGKRKGFHRTTHRANEVAEDGMMQIAEFYRRHCPASAAYCQKKRDAGFSHWQPSRYLARQLIRLIFALFRKSDFYHMNTAYCHLR